MTQKVYKLINAEVSTGGASGKVKITALDTGADVLNAKLTTDSTISKTIVNPGGVEQLRLAVDATQLDHTSLQNVGTRSHAQIDTDIDDLQDKTTKYVHTFNATSDWTLNVDVYELSLAEATHGKGVDPLFYVVDNAGDTVELGSNVDINGNITLSVASDLRFAGKLIVL